MKGFLYVASFFCIAMGCCTILYTDETRKFVKSIFNEIDRKFISAFELIIGILLLISATASRQAWFIRLIGLMAIIEGGVIFLIPKNLYDELMDWYLNSASDQTYRLFGILSLVFGTAILSWIM
ncbi:MAG: DUF2065 family protein [Deltaproteobacteria bacterium]|jgi:uncharacterized protein YjeT (DUF2065 family)|nr:DUF2065 family protein [Deltaproteobacteria bacterium]MBW1969837.1 DUF2065 family protein [Deltaproteobacteria bacterium]MBW2157929.1 DUF2065 family protein [Deltaproteobacteria bacterium]MBW2197570.1 DUF2065 family protein [Deltaproteobacteria bacterium]MBW2325894.1 DUF2065 family protein [Deltaproteobacteria bacterium]